MNKLLKALALLAAGLFLLGSCDKYDDTDLWDKINSIDKRVASLESLVEKMNGNIASLQTIVTKLQATVTISNVKETSTGYTISFTDGTSINLYHGEKGDKGDNGTNGTNGANGKDAPVIGIALYNGIYYWTLTTNGNTTWLTDANGNKIPVTGPKGDKGDTGSGEKGDKGDNAPAPILKVDAEGYWLISNDSGATFDYIRDSTGKKVSALGYQGEKGDKGDKGDQGDSFFKSLVEGDDFVYLTLANDTVITIPKYRGFAISLSCGEQVEITGGESLTISYTLSYGTENSRVMVFPANGWKSEVNRVTNSTGEIRLSAPSIDCEGETVILATDGNGQSTTGAIVCKAKDTGNLIFIADKLYNVSASGANIQVDIQTAVDYTVEIPAEDRSWITLDDVVTKASLREDVAKLVVAENGTPFDRTSTIEIVNKSGTILETIVISQSKGVTENMIVYTSTDGSVVTPYNSRAFGSGISIISNTVSNGKGVLSFNGKVTKIGDNAFANCSTLYSIEIPETITEIGTNAFSGCTSLVDVDFNDNLKVIGSYSFNNCSKLANLYIPDSVEEIQEYAFAGTNLKTVTIGKGLATIVNSLFEGQTNLTSVILSEGLKKVEDNAFKGCTKLNTISFPSSVSSMGYTVLSGCTGLNSITIGGLLTYIPESFCAGLTNLKSVQLREGIEEIRNNAFDGCTGLTTIGIPNTVTSIGAYAYRDCSNATSITLGNNLRTIKEYTFYNCRNLKAVEFPPRVESIGSFAFNQCVSLTELILPASITTIGERAFYQDTGLVSVVINNGTIGSYAFATCSSLVNLTIEKGVIGENAFHNNRHLANLNLKGTTSQNGVTEIGKSAFECCFSLKKIDIPKSVVKIGYAAFHSIGGPVVECYMRPLNPPTCPDFIFHTYYYYMSGSSWNSSSYTKINMYVHTSSVDDYKTAASSYYSQPSYLNIIGYDFE